MTNLEAGAATALEIMLASYGAGECPVGVLSDWLEDHGFGLGEVLAGYRVEFLSQGQLAEFLFCRRDVRASRIERAKPWLYRGNYYVLGVERRSKEWKFETHHVHRAACERRIPEVIETLFPEFHLYVCQWGGLQGFWSDDPVRDVMYEEGMDYATPHAVLRNPTACVECVVQVRPKATRMMA